MTAICWVAIRTFGGILGILISLSGCGDDETVALDSTPSAASDQRTVAEPTLLVSEISESGPSPSARISGQLRINKANCFAIDDSILIAPHGSVRISDPLGVELAGIGKFAVGDRVTASGGYVGDDDDRGGSPPPENQRQCVPAGEPGKFVSINPG